MTRKYGKKRPAASAAAVAIFGSSTQPVPKPTIPSSPSEKLSRRNDLADITNTLEKTRLENPSDDITVLLEKISLDNCAQSVPTVFDQSDQSSSVDAVSILLEETSLGEYSKDTKNVLNKLNESHSLDDVASLLEKTISKEDQPATTIKSWIEVVIPQRVITTNPTPPSLNPRLAASLSPLLSAYEKDNGYPLPTKNWNDVLAPGSSIQKIAEASYAEVFRVTNQAGSSILKLLRLKVPTDPTSKRSDTAIKVETVVSEMRLMTQLTEIPGFVKFKDSHIVEGKPPAAFVKAYEDHLEASGESYFPHPNKISKSAVFLAIELGDAGHVLEKYSIKDVDQLWDIFLGVVIALARAEMEHEFEHRDLHENNICILEHPPKISTSSNPRSKSKSKSQPSEPALPHKYGKSGLEITILDYGLSRATIYPLSTRSSHIPTPETVYYNLESDPAVFTSFEPSTIAGIQFDTYRRMRAYLFSGGTCNANSNTPSKFIRDAIKKKTHSWEEYTPYSNVLWLYFLLEYLTSVAPKGRGGKQGKSGWMKETAELRWLLHPDWLPGNTEDGEEEIGLGCAGDVLQYAFDVGWVREEDLGIGDASRLSVGGDEDAKVEADKALSA